MRVRNVLVTDSILLADVEQTEFTDEFTSLTDFPRRRIIIVALTEVERPRHREAGPGLRFALEYGD